MLNRLKIASKLLVGFGALLLLLAAVSGLSTMGSFKSKSSIQDLVHFKANEVLDQHVEKRIFEARMHMWMALATNDPEQWKQSEEAFRLADERFETLRRNTHVPAKLTKVEQWSEQIRAFRQAAARLRSFTGENEALKTPEGKAAMASAIKLAANAAAFGETLGQEFQDEATQIESGAIASADLIVALAIGVGSASILIGLALAFLITRSIRQPIVDLTRIMGSLAKGNLDVAIPNLRERNEIGDMARSVSVFKENAMERQRLEAEAAANRTAAEAERERVAAERAKAAEEQAQAVGRLAEGLKHLAAGDLTANLSEGFSVSYAQIRDDFNAAVDKLKGTMLAVVASTDTIQSGTRDISSASDDLSRRTEQQAASLEETAAALDEITSTVKKSAESAGHARDVAAAADDDAKKSAVVVREAVQAMDAIANSAQQISQIIGVIDEIAFQTNLLALNAGVEAARAGEAGRGFAVVASEVRALAQRSAEAAKEIKGLISTSATHVDHGVKLVAEAGQSLERIMAQVSEINSIVVEIAAGAHEQATGIQQINTAINQMDQVTQQNAAMVEESTAASHSLSEESAQLSTLIGQFQVGRAAGFDAVRRELRKATPHAFKASSAGAGSRSSKPHPPAQKMALVTAGGTGEAWEEF